MKEILFKGSGVALVTPYDAQQNINYEELEKLVEFQIENNTDAIIACGTTGESSTMTEQEHIDVIQFIIDKVAGRIPVIAGTGSNDTRTAVELSVHAKKMGADGILLITPYYNKTSQKGLIEHYNYIVNEAKLPAIVYNVPSRTGVNILPETYLELSKNSYIVATKEANGDAAALAKTISLCGENLNVYSGEDNMTLPIIAMGGLGVISVFANALPKQMHDLATASLNGDFTAARKLSNQYLELMDGFFMDVNPIPIKDAMNRMGFACGPCRMPLTTMPSDKQHKMQALLKKYDLI